MATDLTNTSIARLAGREVQIEAVVIAHEKADYGEKLTLDHIVVLERAVQGKLLVYASGGEYAIGDVVLFACSPSQPRMIEDFDYRAYLASHDVYATCRVKSVSVLERSNDSELYARELLSRVHDAIRQRIDTIFAPEQAVLLAGLLVGDHDFDDYWREVFVATGTSHIVAASGYNVTMVSMVLFSCCVACGLWRRQAFLLVVVGIVVYACLAGAGPPIVRASIMGILTLMTMHVGRKTTGWNIFFLSLCGMLWFAPRLLFFDVSFQLSGLSTLGLMVFSRPFAQRLSFIPEAFGLRESFSSTLAATAATLPVIVFTFGRVSLVSPIVNLVVLPFLPYTMAAGIIGSILGGIFALPAKFLLGGVLYFLSSVAQVPGGVWDVL